MKAYLYTSPKAKITYLERKIRRIQNRINQLQPGTYVLLEENSVEKEKIGLTANEALSRTLITREKILKDLIEDFQERLRKEIIYYPVSHLYFQIPLSLQKDFFLYLEEKGFEWFCALDKPIPNLFKISWEL